MTFHVAKLSSLNFYSKVEYHLNRTIIWLQNEKCSNIYQALGLN